MAIYQPYHYHTSKSEQSFTKDLRWLKIPNPHSAKYPDNSVIEAGSGRPLLRAITNLSGYATVFLPGDSPSFVLKEASSLPRVLNIRGTPIRGLTPYDSSGSEELVFVSVNVNLFQSFKRLLLTFIAEG